MELNSTLLFGDFCNIVDLPIEDTYLDELINKSYELKDKIPNESGWRCDTYSTFGTNDLINDETFSSLLQIITDRVGAFSSIYGNPVGKLVCKEAWINISQPGNFQEYHKHPLSHFSAVFYLKVPDNSGKLVFKSHEAEDDMFPLILEAGPIQFPSYKTNAIVPGSKRLIIFRSNINHMVEKNLSDGDRISLAANFIYE